MRQTAVNGRAVVAGRRRKITGVNKIMKGKSFYTFFIASNDLGRHETGARALVRTFMYWRFLLLWAA